MALWALFILLLLTAANSQILGVDETAHGNTNPYLHHAIDAWHHLLGKDAIEVDYASICFVYTTTYLEVVGPTSSAVAG